jgi:hypothetical protein
MKIVPPKQLELVEKTSDTLAPQIATPEITERVSVQIEPKLACAGPPDPLYDDFDWSNDDSVILHEQRATAIYRNRYHGIVIRQERAWDEDSDPYMIISEENLVTFMEAFAKRARE